MLRSIASIGRTFAAVAVLAPATALTAPAAFAAPATAATHATTASPTACSVVADMDRDEQTGQLFANGYTTCPVYGPAAIDVSLWVDNTDVGHAGRACALGTNCDESTGMITPYSGRHRYCSRAAFYWASTTPTQVQWSCEYLQG